MLRRLPTPRYASLSPLVFLFLVIYFWSYSTQKRINFDLPSPSWIPIPLPLLQCPRPKQRGSLRGFWFWSAEYVRTESIPSLINFGHRFHNIPRIYLWSFKIHRYTEAFKNMVLSRVIIGIKIGIFILVFTVTSGSLREHPDSSFLFLVSSFYAGETRNMSRKNRMLSRAKFLVLCQKYWPVVLSCLSNLWWVAPHVTQKSHCIVTFSAECFVAYCF